MNLFERKEGYRERRSRTMLWLAIWRTAPTTLGLEGDISGHSFKTNIGI